MLLPSLVNWGEKRKKRRKFSGHSAFKPAASKAESSALHRSAQNLKIKIHPPTYSSHKLQGIQKKKKKKVNSNSNKHQNAKTQNCLKLVFPRCLLNNCCVLKLPLKRSRKFFLKQAESGLMPIIHISEALQSSSQTSNTKTRI